jgi:hypothetical protein
MLHRLLTATPIAFHGAWLAVLTALAVPALAAAQPPAQTREVQLPTQYIEGRRQIPVEVFTRRSEVGYDVIEIRTSFVERVVESVEGPAF